MKISALLKLIHKYEEENNFRPRVITLDVLEQEELKEELRDLLRYHTSSDDGGIKFAGISVITPNQNLAPK